MSTTEVEARAATDKSAALPDKVAPSIFRPAALTRLSSPERLDLGARVVRPASWLILLALGLLIVGSTVAAVLIKVPVKASARGMLLSPEGLKEVVATSNGQIKVLKVQAGDIVHAGDDVALIAQPDAGRELQSALAAERDAQKELERVSAFQGATAETLEKMRGVQKQNVEGNIAFSDQRIKMLEDRRKGQDLLLAHGFLAKDRLLETYVEIGNARVERAKLETQLKQLDSDALGEKIQRERELLLLQFKVGDAKRLAESAKEKLDRLIAVKSPYTGVVAELKMNEGEVVGNGTPIFSVFPEDDAKAGSEATPLVAALYVSQAEGKRVHPGMEVEIAPATVKREEYGFMVGKVTSVAELPSTMEGMMRTLKNQQLVQALAAEGAPFQVTARLERAPKTPSGYRWSTSQGPPTMISHATPCAAEVVVKTVPLVNLILPALHKVLGDLG